jgi:hypothetical protein
MARVHGKLVNAGDRRIAIPVHRRRTIDAVQGDGSDNPPVGDRNEAVSEPDALARDGNSLIDTSAVQALAPERGESPAQQTRQFLQRVARPKAANSNPSHDKPPIADADPTEVMSACSYWRAIDIKTSQRLRGDA